MKILIVTQYFWPESFRVNDLALGLKEKGHKVTVLTGYPHYPDRIYGGYKVTGIMRENYDGVMIIRVPIYPYHGLKALLRILNYTSYAVMASLIGPFICRGEIDSIIVFQPGPVSVGIPAIVMSKVKRAPIFFWVQDLWPEALSATGVVTNKLLLKMVSFLSKIVYGSSYVLLSQSPGISRALKTRLRDSQCLEELPNWAENFYQVVSPDLALKKREGMEGYFNVVFAGNVGAAQDIDVIIEAARLLAEYPKIKMTILGDGALLQESQEKVRRLQLRNIEFKGRKPVEMMPNYFSLADALLVQLKKDPLFTITIPSKLQTYMASGRPIIGALEGDGAGVIERSGCGLVCEPGNPQELKEAILKMYYFGVEERRHMGQRARDYLDRNFSRDVLLDRLENIMLEYRYGKQEGA